MFDQEMFDKEGYAVTAPLFSSQEIAEMLALLGEQQRGESDVRRGGRRDVMDDLPAMRTMAEHQAVQDFVEAVLSTDAFVVRATLFDKTESANWKVPWHQDVTIAVKERRDTPGYGPWSVKGGVTHVQPPSEVLERMVTVRVHLDDCPESNGALRVMPGTHRLGRLNQNWVDASVAKWRLCAVRRRRARRW